MDSTVVVGAAVVVVTISGVVVVVEGDVSTVVICISANVVIGLVVVSGTAGTASILSSLLCLELIFSATERVAMETTARHKKVSCIL